MVPGAEKQMSVFRENMNVTPLSTLTDSEILQWAYMTRENRSALEIELAVRLEHACDELRKRTMRVDDIVGRYAAAKTTGY